MWLNAVIAFHLWDHYRLAWNEARMEFVQRLIQGLKLELELLELILAYNCQSVIAMTCVVDLYALQSAKLYLP